MGGGDGGGGPGGSNCVGDKGGGAADGQSQSQIREINEAREAKKQRQGQLRAGIAMALGGEAAAAIATGL